MAVKPEQKAELQRLGLWKQFCSFREAARASGSVPAKMTPTDYAWQVFEERVRAINASQTPDHAKREGMPASPSALPADEVSTPVQLPGSASHQLNAEMVGLMAPAPDMPPPPEGGWQRSQFSSVECPYEQAVMWVWNYLAIADVRPEDCPAQNAWNLLIWARSSPINMTAFFNTHVSKFAPTRKELEAKSRFHDDGSNVTAAIEERLLTMKRDAEAQAAATTAA